MKQYNNYHLSQALHIGSSCVISNGIVYKDQQELFCEQTAPDVLRFLTNAYRHFDINYPRFYKMDNLCKLGWLCTEILLKKNADGNLNGEPGLLEGLRPESVCVLLCNANSSLDTDHKYFETVSQMASPALFVYTLPNIVIGEICIRNGWKGENMFLVLKDFDADFLQQQVQYLMNSECNKACICGWIDLLGNDYKAVMFIVEKQNDGRNPNFTTENITNTYQNRAEKEAAQKR